MGEKRLSTEQKWGFFRQMGYNPTHPEVKRFHNSEAQIKVVTAARRGSKSWSASHDAFDTVLYPDTITWIVGPTYTLAEKEFRYIHQRLVVEGKKYGIPKPKICNYNPRSGNMYIKFAWGAEVICKSADNPASLLGDAVDLVIYSESAQLKREIRERYVQPTVITTRGRELVPTTPDQAGEWVRELVEKGERADFPDIDCFHWDVRANPTYPREEFERARRFYGKDHPVFREQYLGEWVFHSGRVYPTFQEASHVIEPFQIPRDWPVIRGIDFGGRDPFVCLMVAIGPHGELYQFDEYYNRDGIKSIPEHASVIHGMSKGYRIRQTVADPSGAQQIEDLAREGIGCNKANHDIDAGHMRVSEYLACNSSGVPPWPLRDEPIAEAQKKWPRMYVFSTCRETIREYKYYRWREARLVQGDKERTEGENHAMDTKRYICMTRPSPFKTDSMLPAGSFGRIMRGVQSSKADPTRIGINVNQRV
jgi:hypothetical protein